jgi:hypothetical protein
MDSSLRPTRCQTIQCRRVEDRQDLQCTRRNGHEGRHLRTIALGWCERPDLANPRETGRKGGHTNPVIG